MPRKTTTPKVTDLLAHSDALMALALRAPNPILTSAAAALRYAEEKLRNAQQECRRLKEEAGRW